MQLHDVGVVDEHQLLEHGLDLLLRGQQARGISQPLQQAGAEGLGEQGRVAQGCLEGTEHPGAAQGLWESREPEQLGAWPRERGRPGSLGLPQWALAEELGYCRDPGPGAHAVN